MSVSPADIIRAEFQYWINHRSGMADELNAAWVRLVENESTVALEVLGKRNPLFCPHGHPRTKENTYYTKKGSYYCRVCHSEGNRQTRKDKKDKVNDSSTDNCLDNGSGAGSIACDSVDIGIA